MDQSDNNLASFIGLLMILLGILMFAAFAVVLIRGESDSTGAKEEDATGLYATAKPLSLPSLTATAPPATPTRHQAALETPVATVARFPTPIPHPPHIDPDCEWAPLLAIDEEDRVHIQVVRGSWAVWGGPGGVRHRTDGAGYVDERPSGDPLSSAPAGALIGRVGNGEPFYVGNDKAFTASQSGTLELRINDTMCSDNTGSLSVRLLVTSPGDQAPQSVEPAFIPSDPTEPTNLVRLQHPVNQVAFSPGGETLAVAAGSTIHLYDTATLAELVAIETETGVMSVAFSSDGYLLASGSHPDGAVCLWRVSDGTLLRTLEGHAAGVWSVAFSPDGQTLASGSLDHTVRLWQTRGCEDQSTGCGALLHILADHPNAVTSVAFSPECVSPPDTPAERCGETLAVGVWDNKTVWLWQARDGELLNTLHGGANRVTSLAFSPDPSVLASASQEGRVLLWQTRDWAQWQTLGGHPDIVYSVAFSPDGQTLAAGTLDNTVWLWRVNDAARLAILDGGAALVTSVAFSPDGRTLASGSHDGTVQLWDLAEVQTD